MPHPRARWSGFIHHHLGNPIASTVALGPLVEQFVTAIDAFVRRVSAGYAFPLGAGIGGQQSQIPYRTVLLDDLLATGTASQVLAS